MTRRRAGEAGFTLIEVLLAMSLMLLVFAATLAVFTTMERGESRNQKLNDAQDQARVATDTLARRLRNLASPSNGVTAGDQQPLELASAQDLVFRTVKSTGTPTAANPQNLERYRYCLGTDKQLYEMVQTWTGAVPAVPATTTCTATSPGWSSIRVVASNVVNGARAIFNYQGSSTPGTYTDLTSVATADFPTAIALRSTLYIDPDTVNPPGETQLTTRVFLRNQNRPPLPSFTVTTSGKKVTLNASESEDPEGNALSYQFFDNNVALAAASTSAVLSVTAAAGTHSYKVTVTDVGYLSVSSDPKTVTCVSSGSTIACN
jgi:prepilin-type N-terminal cleavage/methylation domain-containing protein